MKNVLQRCHKKRGSVLIVVIALFAVLAIFFASFMKSTTSRTHSTKKIGDTMLARELANSLAIASFHYIKNVALKDEGSDLRKILAEPMPYSSNSIEKGDLTAGVKSYIKEGTSDIITSLLEKSGLESVKLEEMTWRIHKGDFSILKLDGDDSPYPREKKGVVRVFIKLSYKLPGQKDSISEDYLFASAITVSANLIPVLSKFNFYVEDAFGGNKPSGDDDELLYRFNQVSTTAGGKLKSGSSHCPWIFHNGSNEKVPESYKDLVASKKGLIYLGGGDNSSPIVLGVARGFTDVERGDYGEDFHFFKRGSGGYWKTYEVWGNGTGILSANIGLCDDDSTYNLGIWQDMFGEGYRKQSTVNSIFRLFGTDTSQSPTMVLGYVNAMSGDVRAYKGENGTNKLAFFDNYEDFINFSGLNYFDQGETIGYTYQYSKKIYNIKAFSSAYSSKTGLKNNNSSALEEFYETYKDKYGTKVIENRYNKDYAFILAKSVGKGEDDIAYPLEYCTDVIKGDLKTLCELKSNDLFEKIPTCDEANYGKIYSTDKLTDVSAFLDAEKLGIDGSEDSTSKERIAKVFEYTDGGSTLEDYLKFRKLLIKGDDDKYKLELSGWLYIECDSGSDTTIELDKYTVSTQGGFIVANKGGGKGNIRIKGNITGEHLTIIALNGDITVDNSVTEVDASLIAGNGQIKLDCAAAAGSNQNLQVKGNIVMKQLTKANIDSSFKRCLVLDYCEDLAARPYCSKSGLSQDDLQKTEYPLLMFDLKEDIVMLD